MTSSGDTMSSAPDSGRGLTSSRRRRHSNSAPRKSTSTKRRPVFLWQFLRDLLQLPSCYHTGVRWIDRDAGQTLCLFSLLGYKKDFVEHKITIFEYKIGW